jgi:hypothetical protein
LSIYAYLNCHDCRQSLWLGKAVCHLLPQQQYFHIGSADDPRNWKREDLNQVLWKFLADHCGHRIDVRREDGMTEEMFGYQSIGGDRYEDVSFEAYVAGWRGLEATDRGTP